MGITWASIFDKLITGAIPAAIVGMVVWYWQRKITKREQARENRTEVRAERRKTESLLMLEMLMACGKLSFAVAMAVKRGTPNGEIEDGIEAYNNALEQYEKFMRDEHCKNVVKI